MTENLCDGPRGRRLVLELVRDALPDEVKRGLWELASQSDVDAGGSVTRLVFSGGDGPSEPTPAPVTTAALAGAIRAVGAPTPIPAALDAAMLRAVDSARYWQAPEGDDIRLRSCPFAEAAERHPGIVCEVHRGLVERIAARDSETAHLVPFASPSGCLVRR